MVKMTDNKTKKSIWLPEETWKMIDSHRDTDVRQSIAGFIDAAVKHYCCTMDSDTHKEILSEELIRVIHDIIKNAENHIASTLFKLAGEQATLSLIFADRIVGDITRETVEACRQDAYKTIRKWHGVYTFDDALDNAEEIYNNVDLRSDNE